MTEIPKLTGIEEFWLSNKISTQADNAAGGLAKCKTLAPGFQRWGQTERPKETQRDPGKDKGPWGGEFLCNFGKTDRPRERQGPWGGEFLCNFGKTDRPRERQVPWGGEFLCNFGHHWEADKINKQRKEPDPSIPCSLLLIHLTV